MSKALDAFLEHWKGHSPLSPFHPKDAKFLSANGLLGRFEANLSPYPFVGNLKKAKVWILMRNPSIGDADYLEERRLPLSDLLWRNLAREFGEYPFLHLNPAINPSDAYNWWNFRRGFAQLAVQVAERLRTTEVDARKLIAQRVAILESCPYRSRCYPPAILASESSRLAVAAAQEAVSEAISEGNRGFVIPWDASCWQLPRNAFDSVVRNQTSQGFTFRMGATSRFGEHIWKYAFSDA